MGKTIVRTLLIVLAAFLGGFVFLAASDYALVTAAWCITGEDHCVREWFGAGSGWMAAIAAIVTIWILIPQTRAAIDAATTARESLEVSRDSSERQLRAYIVVADIVGNPITFDDQAAIDIEIRNCGQTPAYEISLEMRWTLERDSDTKWTAEPTHSKLMDVGPGQSFTARCRFNAKAIEHVRAEIMSGAVKHKFYGTISYVDAFSKKRSTAYRYYFDPDVGERGGRFILEPGGTTYT